MVSTGLSLDTTEQVCEQFGGIFNLHQEDSTNGD